MSQNMRGLPEWSEDTGVLKDKYEYDENANVIAIADWLTGTNNRGIQYDNLDRLKSVNAAGLWGDATYTYDALDNLKTTTITAGKTARNIVHNYSAATNKLDSITGTAAYSLAYGYDLQGNVTRRGAQTFTFDVGNRLTQATGKGTYRYDGLGHRVSVVGTDNVNRIQVYSQEGQLLYAAPTTVPLASGNKYIYLHNHLIAEQSAAGVQ
jgi:hypothetical protein